MLPKTCCPLASSGRQRTTAAIPYRRVNICSSSWSPSTWKLLPAGPPPCRVVGPVFVCSLLSSREARKLFTVGYCYRSELFSLDRDARRRYDAVNVGYRGKSDTLSGSTTD